MQIGSEREAPGRGRSRVGFGTGRGTRRPGNFGDAMRSAAAAGALLLGVGGEAWGHGCDPTDNDIAAANTVIARIQLLETVLTRELRLQTGQLSGYIAQGSRAVVEGLSGHAKLRAQTAREEAEARSAVERAPSLIGCRTASGMAGLGPAAGVARLAFAGTAESETGRVAGDADAIGYDPAMDASVRMRRGRDLYGRDGPRPHGDLLYESLFGADRLEGAESQEAALDYARNLVQPVALPPPPEARTPGDRHRAMQRRAHDARVGLAAAWAARAVADRVPAIELGGWARAVAPGTVGPGAAISERELLEALATGRTGDPGWLAGLSALTEAELLREIVRNQAIGMRIAMRRLEMAEHAGAMTAALLAIAAEEARTRPIRAVAE